MKKNRSIYPLCLFFLISCGVWSAASAEEAGSEKREIITDGQAKMFVKPDSAKVLLGIVSLGETVSAAREENSGKIAKTFSALEKLKIPGLKISNPGYNVYLVKENEYETTKTGKLPRILGYKVFQAFSVTLQDKDIESLSKNAGRIIDTGLENGINIINDMSFYSADDRQEQLEVKKLAVKAAIENAQAIAESAGVRIEGYNEISTSSAYNTPQRPFVMQEKMGMDLSQSTPTSFAAGEVELDCTVQIRCKIK
jgi:uncharacterized protein